MTGDREDHRSHIDSRLAEAGTLFMATGVYAAPDAGHAYIPAAEFAWEGSDYILREDLLRNRSRNHLYPGERQGRCVEKIVR